jgi:hypothetical protein
MPQIDDFRDAPEPDDGQPARGRFRALALQAISGRLVYGAVVILAALLAIDSTDVDVAKQIGAVLLATFAVVFAELYSDIVGAMIRERRRLNHDELVTMTTQLGSLALAAVPPLALTLLAWVGLMSVETAGWLSAWLLIGLLFAFGFAAARAAGGSIIGSAFGAALLLGVGLTMVLFKAAAMH